MRIEERNRGDGRRLTVAVSLLAVAAAIVVATISQASHGGEDPTGRTTLEHTIVGGDPEQRFATLGLGPGEPHVVRETLAQAKEGRAARRVSLIYSGQITDFQLADEESPAREERFDADPFSRVSTSGYRPQEPLVVHEVELTIRQMNLFLDSPVRQGNGRRARLANAVMTGDLADNMQRNETGWVQTLLEGGTLDPNSGTNDLAGTKCAGLGVGLDNPRNYTGVADYSDYSPPNSIHYDPAQPLGFYGSHEWPVYPDTGNADKSLFDRAQDPFQAQGLKVPSYVAFGNHDGLYQGTVQAAPGAVTPGATFEQTAVDCLKPVYPLSNQDALGNVVSPDTLAGLLASDPSKVMRVPPDQRRQFVNHPQFKNIFLEGSQPDGHGFGHVDGAELSASDGVAAYYSFSPKPGIRYIVLDTLSEGAVGPSEAPGAPATGSDGNIDNPQFQWLRRELTASERRDELVVTWGHHAVTSLTNATPDEAAPCTGSPDSHGHDTNPSCDLDPRSSSPVHTGSDLRDLLLAHPHAIAYVAGHSHENRIRAYQGQGGRAYWEIKSPAVADFPPQHRLIEVMDNKDGTLSIFGTMLDFAAPTGIPASGTDPSGFDLRTLGAIGRVLTYNDPQQGGGGTADGEQTDRNVELLIRDPRRSGGGGGGGGLKPGRCANRRVGTGRPERLSGTGAGDRLLGRGGRDRILGFAAADCLLGGAGPDRLHGGKGADRLKGQRGADRLQGDSGRDDIRGNGGRDVLNGGAGRDRFLGGLDRDLIRAADGTRDVVRCGRGRDRAIVDRRDRVRSCERVRRRQAD